VIRLLIEADARPGLRVRLPSSTINKGPTALTVLLLNSTANECVEGSMGSMIDSTGSRSRGKKLWMRSLEQLLRGGAKWEPSLASSTGQSQLSLLYAFFPPYPSDVDAYIRVIGDAIDAGFDLNKEDSSGRSALFTLCVRMAETPLLECIDCMKIIKVVISLYGNRGFGKADKKGMSILDIRDKVEKSCFNFVKKELANAVMKSSPDELLT
jgi:hypothetical protein